MSGTPSSYTFGAACGLLGASPEEMRTLRQFGLLVADVHGRRHSYPAEALHFTQALLQLARAQNWPYPTLCWYADLLFASEIGRIVLLPLVTESDSGPRLLVGSWLETPYAAAFLKDAMVLSPVPIPQVVPVLQSLLSGSVGVGKFWKDNAALRQGSMGPLLAYYEGEGHHFPVGETTTGQHFALLILAFATLAPAISSELRQLALETYARLKGSPIEDLSLDEQERIRRERLVAVDKMYAERATEIHSAPSEDQLNFHFEAVPQSQKRIVALEIQKPSFLMSMPIGEAPQEASAALDNILDIIRPFLGAYGARVIQLLYEVANDPPNWRQPIITLDTNILLDRLGEKRDARGIHYSRNRARLRDALNAAHNLEIVGEYRTIENGVVVRKAGRRTVLSIIGATFEANESEGLTTAELFLKGLPRSLQLQLNFYDGVRRGDGRLGDSYILMPRLSEESKTLPKANYAATPERLKQYLRAKERQGTPNRIVLTRGEAIQASGITNKNITRATQTLQKGLDKLVEEGFLERFDPIPLPSNMTFALLLAEE